MQMWLKDCEAGKTLQLTEGADAHFDSGEIVFLESGTLVIITAANFSTSFIEVEALSGPLEGKKVILPELVGVRIYESESATSTDKEV